MIAQCLVSSKCGNTWTTRQSRNVFLKVSVGSEAQVAVDQVIDWSKKNLFQLNGDKTKELTITFSHNSSKFPRALIDGLPIASVNKTKLLGVTINSSLTCNDHIEDLLKKASRKLYFLRRFHRKI